MGKVQIETRWVPHKLIERQKCDRMNICISLLGHHRKKYFLWRIVTGDEKWVCYENPVRKRRLVDPEKSSSSVPKREIHGKKLLLSIWWHMKSVLYKELLESGVTITAERYSNQLLKVNEKDLILDTLFPSQKTRFRKFVGKFYCIRPIHRTWHLQITICSGLWNIYSQTSTSIIVK